jgi:hypothetical protein
MAIALNLNLLIGTFMTILEKELLGDLGPKLRLKLRRPKGGPAGKTCPRCGKALPEPEAKPAEPVGAEDRSTSGPADKTYGQVA